MKFKYYLACLLAAAMIFTGCGRTFDGSGYVTSVMDALYKGDYTSYMDMTGVSRSDASLYRDQWLLASTEAFLTAFGSGTPSEATSDRITSLLTQLDANASYTVASQTKAASGELTVSVSIRQLNILIDNYDAIQSFVKSFNEKNAAFSYADLTEEAYYDAYLDGILTILESHLSDMSFGDEVVIDLTLTQNDDGLYTLSEDSLTQIQNTILPWPDVSSQS